MTNAEHLMMWIENSGPYYKKLLALKPGNFYSETDLAYAAYMIVASAYKEGKKGGDFDNSFTASELFEAGQLVLAWEFTA